MFQNDTAAFNVWMNWEFGTNLPEGELEMDAPLGRPRFLFVPADGGESVEIPVIRVLLYLFQHPVLTEANEKARLAGFWVPGDGEWDMEAAVKAAFEELVRRTSDEYKELCHA